MNDDALKSEGTSILLDTAIYSMDAIKKAAYKFADRATVVLKRGEGPTISVVFNSIAPKSKDDVEQIIADFHTELLDQDLREIVRRETGAIRNALIAHAFSRTSLVERG